MMLEPTTAKQQAATGGGSHRLPNQAIVIIDDRGLREGTAPPEDVYPATVFVYYDDESMTRRARVFFFDKWLKIFIFIDFVFIIVAIVFLMWFAFVGLILVALAYLGTNRLDPLLIGLYGVWRILLFIGSIVYLAVESHSAFNIVLVSLGMVIDIFLVTLVFFLNDAIEELTVAEKKDTICWLESTPFFACCGSWFVGCPHHHHRPSYPHTPRPTTSSSASFSPMSPPTSVSMTEPSSAVTASSDPAPLRN